MASELKHTRPQNDSSPTAFGLILVFLLGIAGDGAVMFSTGHYPSAGIAYLLSLVGIWLLYREYKNGGTATSSNPSNSFPETVGERQKQPAKAFLTLKPIVFGEFFQAPRIYGGGALICRLAAGEWRCIYTDKTGESSRNLMLIPTTEAVAAEYETAYQQQFSTHCPGNGSVLQPWVCQLTLMQQSVLISAIRGPDGVGKFHACKTLIKWYRRCVLIAAFEGRIFTNPTEPGGGSFTGPIGSWRVICEDWEGEIKSFLDSFITARDELPYHYTTHFMHAAEILGYKHPDPRIRAWWLMVYHRMVNCLHLAPETEAQLDARLGDDEAGWQNRSDETATCSD